MEALAAAIGRGELKQLKVIALDGNQISLPMEQREAVGQAGAHSSGAAVLLGAALATLPQLTHLDLSSNPKLSDAAAAAFCAGLLDSSAAVAAGTSLSLRVLHLGGTGAGNNAAIACAEAAVLTGSALASLCLSGAVGDRGANALAAAVPLSPTLAELWLGGTISDDGCASLVGASATPSSKLKTLALGGQARGGVQLSNSIGRGGAIKAAEALRNGSSLADLRLSGNHAIGGDGVIQILGALPGQSSLRTLRCDECGLAKSHVPFLMSALNEVHCLHELACEGGRSRSDGKRNAGVGLLTLKEKMSISKILDDNRRRAGGLFSYGAGVPLVHVS